MRKGKYLGFSLIFVFFVAAASFWEMSVRQNNLLSTKQGAIFSPNNAKIVALGKDIYQNNCASCHGVNLEGEANWKNPNENGLLPAPPHDESGHTWHHTDKLLFDIVKVGLGKAANLPDYETNMPIYENVLNDEEIIAILSYIKSTWPKEIQQRHDSLNAQSVDVQ
ncbi:MAG: cytochrome c [Devosiaceae bacterium]|nr:cytochrome c [Devosiaceae bacterium]